MNFFLLGELGWWWDYSDLSVLFQDDAGTIPVTATGQPVRRVNDKSGNGNHITAGLLSGAIFRDVAGKRYLEFTPPGRGLSTPSAVNFGGSANITCFSGIEMTGTPIVAIFLESSESANLNAGTFAGFAPTDFNANNFAFRGHSTVANGPIVIAGGFPPPSKQVITTKSYAGQPIEIRIGGVSFTGGNASGTLVNHRLFVGSRNMPQQSIAFTGKLFPSFGRVTQCTALEIADAEAYLTGKTF